MPFANGMFVIPFLSFCYFAFLSHECQDADIVDVNAICSNVTTRCGDVYTICVQVGFEAEEAASAS